MTEEVRNSTKVVALMSWNEYACVLPFIPASFLAFGGDHDRFLEPHKGPQRRVTERYWAEKLNFVLCLVSGGVVVVRVVCVLYNCLRHPWSCPFPRLSISGARSLVMDDEVFVDLSMREKMDVRTLLCFALRRQPRHLVAEKRNNVKEHDREHRGSQVGGFSSRNRSRQPNK